MKQNIINLEIEEVKIKGKLKNNSQIELVMDKETFFKWKDKLRKK